MAYAGEWPNEAQTDALITDLNRNLAIERFRFPKTTNPKNMSLKNAQNLILKRHPS